MLFRSREGGQGKNGIGIVYEAYIYAHVSISLTFMQKCFILMITMIDKGSKRGYLKVRKGYTPMGQPRGKGIRKKKKKEKVAQTLAAEQLELKKAREEKLLEALKPLPDISKFDEIFKHDDEVSDLTKACLLKFRPFRNENKQELIWTSSQIKIIDAIINRSCEGKKRIHIMASTQVGKSCSVAAGALMAVAFLPEKWALVAGTTKQARIIMKYIISYATDNELFVKQLEIPKGKVERLKRELNKNALTFKNGGRIEIFTAQVREGVHGDDNKGITGVMGFGAPNIICDESALIPDKKFVLIMRMLGGHKDNFLVQIGNPFERNHFLDAFKSPDYAKITLDYKKALKEGRYTPEFIREMQKADPELFEILYACKFPSETDELAGKWRPLITQDQLKQCIEKPADDIGRGFGTKILGVDLAGGGYNYNVGVVRTRNYARVLFKKRKVKTPFLANYLLDLIEEEKINPYNVNLDKQGVGHGLYEILSVRGFQGTNVGVRANDPVTFVNKRAENYYRLYQWLMGGGKLSAANYKDWFQLTKIFIRIRNGKLIVMSKAEAQSRGIMSPDVADALMLTFDDCVNYNADVDESTPYKPHTSRRPPSAMAV